MEGDFQQADQVSFFSCFRTERGNDNLGPRQGAEIEAI